MKTLTEAQRRVIDCARRWHAAREGEHLDADECFGSSDALRLAVVLLIHEEGE
jgi:hypothetical protein